MNHKDKVLLTFCAYLKDGFGAISFKNLFSSDEVPDPFKYLKNNFSELKSQAKKFIEEVEKNEIGYICLWEDKYPLRLKAHPNPPIILFYKGDVELLKKEIVAVIGTRNCSNLGKLYVKMFTKELVKFFVICSGMAFGIDSLANLTSAEQTSSSIIVLPGSLLSPQPRGNEFIFKKVLDSGGLILSEYPFSTELVKGSFIQRNRIIAGISENVLLIESPLEGGSLSTCKIAFHNNSHVHAIPANIGLKTFEGNNQLLRDQIAKVITSPSDLIIKENRLIFSNKSYNLNSSEQIVYDCITKFGDFDSLYMALKDKMGIKIMYDILLNLEMNGIIIRDISGNYIIN